MMEMHKIRHVALLFFINHVGGKQLKNFSHYFSLLLQFVHDIPDISCPFCYSFNVIPFFHHFVQCSRNKWCIYRILNFRTCNLFVFVCDLVAKPGKKLFCILINFFYQDVVLSPSLSANVLTNQILDTTFSTHLHTNGPVNLTFTETFVNTTLKFSGHTR